MDVVKHNNYNILVGKILRYPYLNADQNSILIKEENEGVPNLNIKPKAILVNNNRKKSIQQSDIPIYFVNKDILDRYFEGDIIFISAKGIPNLIYRTCSSDNVIFVTNCCNSRCIMCPQPPVRQNDFDFLYEINNCLIEIMPKTIQTIGITGGEPTLLGDRLPLLLAKLKENFPEIRIDLLSNGILFSNVKYVESIAKIGLGNLVYAISLHSDNNVLHDFISQTKNSFFNTVKGIYNLAEYNQRIEIRFVLHKQSVERVLPFAKFIIKNMPFVEHIAFMGLEYTGNTPKNDNLVWIDPYDYMENLYSAIALLNTYKMYVSIYNLQLCLLPKELREFSRKSISDWKNIYLPCCAKCSELEKCGGFFASSLIKNSDHIHAI